MLETVDTTTSAAGIRSQFSPFRRVKTQSDGSSLRFEAAPLSPTLQAGLRRLASLEALPADWDSYGSPPPQGMAVLIAKSALASAAALYAPLPAIGPVSGGGIHLAWENRGRVLELSMFPDGSCEFLAEGENEESEGQLEMSDSAPLRRLLRWYLRSGL